MNTNAISNLMDREVSGMLKRDTRYSLTKPAFRNGTLKAIYFFSSILMITLNLRAQDLTTDLALHLPFSESISDAGPNSQTTTNIGGAVFSSDRFNYQDSAMFFDGINDNISVTHSASLQTGTYFSVAFWFKTTKTTNQWLVVKGDGSAFETRYQMNMNPDGTLVFVITAASSYKFASSNPGFNDGNWHFVVARKYLNSVNTMEIDLWVDNIFQSTTNTGYPNYTADNLDNLSLGSFAANAADRFLGSLDDFRLYKKKLSELEMMALLSLKPKELNSAPQLTSPLPSIIDLNEGYPPYTFMDLDSHFEDPDGTPLLITVSSANSGLVEASLENRKLVLSPVYNSTGTTTLTISAIDYTDTLSNTITVNVNPVTGPDIKKGLTAYFPFNGDANDESGNGWLPVSSPPITTDRFGIPNSAGNGRFLVNNFMLSDPNELSLSFWIKSDFSSTSSHFFFEHSGNWSARTANGLLQAGNNQQRSTSRTFNPGQWYHVALTMENGGNMLLYVDTVQINMGSFATAFLASASVLGVGGITANGTQSFNGKMDDIRIYRRILSKDEVIQLFAEEKFNLPPVPLYESRSFMIDEKTISELKISDLYKDPENQAITFTVSNYFTQNSAVLINNNRIRFTPDPEFTGTDTIYVQVSDGDTLLNDTLLFAIKPLKSPEIDSLLHTQYGFNGSTRDKMGRSANLGLFYGINPSQVTDRFGQPNGSYNFNGGVVSISNFNNGPLTNGFSFSFWMKPLTEMEPASGRRVIYDHRGTTSTLYYESGSLKLSLNNTTNTIYSLDTFFLAEQWYHIAVTAQEGGKVRFYINGKEYLVGDAPAMLDQRAQALYFGGTINTLTGQGKDYLFANLDDFRFYTRTLNYLEVDSLYRLPEFAFQTFTKEICQGDTITKGGKSMSTAGIHFYIEPGSPDTLVEMDLVINSLPPVKAVASRMKVYKGTEISLRGSGANTYSWDNGVQDGIPFVINDSTLFTLTGTDTKGCQNTTQVLVQVIPVPLPESAVTGTMTDFCGEQSAFTTISIDTSAVGLEYYLRKGPGNGIVRGPVAGTGSSLNFETDTISETTIYNIYAEKNPGITSGLDFDGTNDKVVIPYNASMDVIDEFTFEAWVYPRSANYDRYIGNFSGTGNTVGDIVIDGGSSVDNGRGLRLYMVALGPAAKQIAVNNVLTLNQWNHIAAVFNKGNMLLYANGLQVATGNFGATTIPANTANFILGEDNGGTTAEFLNGIMDEVRFWNIARTSFELNSSMNSELTGNEDGLTAYYKFDEGSGTVLNDYSQNSNNGTLTNMNASTDWVDGIVSTEIPYSDQLIDTVIISIDLPQIFASENDTIMLGDSIEISASGGTYYTWDYGLGEGQSHTVSPLVTTTYTVTGSNGDCSNTDEVTIIVIPVPQLVNPIADITLSEDEDLMGIASLDTVFTEPSGGAMNFTVNSSDPGVEVTISGSVISLSTLQDFNGNAIIKVIAENANGFSTDEFYVTVNPVNDTPVIVLDRDEVNVLENFNGSEIITAQVTQPANEESQDISYTLIPASVSFASVVLDSTGTVIIQAIMDSTGTQEFMIIADDMQPENNSDTAVFILSVSTIPVPFVENPLSDRTFDEDMVLISGFDLNDVFSHPVDATLTFTAVSDNANLMVSVSGSLLELLGKTDSSGSGVITVTASDGTYTVSDDFTVNVNPVNDKPLLTLSKSEVSVLKNFESVQTVTSIVTQPANEVLQSLSFELIPATLSFVSLSMDALGVLSIGAITDSSGTAELMIVVNDGEPENNTDTAIFVLNVTSIPVPVVENPIADQAFDEDEVSFFITDLNSIFSHPASAVLSFSGLSNNEDVIVTVSGNSLTITASPDYYGAAMITVAASDGTFSASDEFNLIISPVNDAPVFTLSQTFMNMDVNFTDPVIVNVIPGFTANESDQTVSYTLEPSGVTFVGIAFNSATGELEILPNVGEPGSQIFTVIANDGQTENNLFSQTFELNVSANLAPVVVSPVTDINIDEDISPTVVVSDITLVFNDPENDELSYSVSSDNPFVVPVIQGNSLVIELAGEYSGSASLSLTANDGDNETSDEFTVNVIPVNDPPAFELSQSSQTLTVNFLGPSIISANSLQPENESGQGITYTLTPAFVEFAAVSIDPSTGTITINPVLNASGNQVFTVTADDGQSKSNLFSQEFTLSVLNDNPTDIIISVVSIQENIVEGTVVGLLSIQDDNAAIPVFSLVAGNGDEDNFSFSIVNDQLITNEVFNFEEKSNYSIRVGAEDGLGGALEKVFIITVTDQDDLPEAILLSNNKITENHAIGMVVGDFSVIDEDQGQFSSNYEFSLVIGDGIIDADNANFAISESSLLLNGVLDATLKPKHFINVMASNESKIILALAEDNINVKNEFNFDAATIFSAFVIEVSETDPTGLQLSELYSVRAYPNPSKGIFTIEFLHKMDKELILSIYDLNGNQVKTVNVNPGSKSIMLELADQKPGLYLMKIISEGYSTTIPLVRE